MPEVVPTTWTPYPAKNASFLGQRVSKFDRGRSVSDLGRRTTRGRDRDAQLVFQPPAQLVELEQHPIEVAAVAPASQGIAGRLYQEPAVHMRVERQKLLRIEHVMKRVEHRHQANRPVNGDRRQVDSIEGDVSEPTGQRQSAATFDRGRAVIPAAKRHHGESARQLAGDFAGAAAQVCDQGRVSHVLGGQVGEAADCDVSGYAGSNGS